MLVPCDMRSENQLTIVSMPAQAHDMFMDTKPCKMDHEAAKSLPHSSGSSTYSHMSNQSSAGFFLTDSDVEDANVDRPRLGSWAGRQAYFPAAAQHLPEQVSLFNRPSVPLEFGFFHP